LPTIASVILTENTLGIFARNEIYAVKAEMQH